MLSCFAPVIDQYTTKIVVGTMPGTDSLKAGEYYAHKRNQFWKIIYDIFEGGRTPIDYSDKLNTLLAHRIGLWDILAFCEREGSLDSEIKNETVNDFPGLLSHFSNVGTLIFNGQNSYKYFKKAFGDLEGIAYAVMPSTSSANATKGVIEKMKFWQQVLK